MITVAEQDIGLRLDQFLAKIRPEHSRSYWQKEIKAGRVLVDGSAVIPHYKLAAGEKITITEPPAPAAPGKPPPLIILAETPDYLIVEKPAGLLVHATETSNEPTLVDAVLKHDPAIVKIGENPQRPGIVHRLDREASGVMVVAKTPEMFKHLKNAFANREIKKEYHALVHGVIEKDEGEIAFRIDRAEGRSRMVAKPTDDESGRAARTTFEVLKRFHHATLVLARPETGRTHQIRAHFHALGHPIVGDMLYKIKKQKAGKLDPTRLMLHATKLSFTDLSGAAQTFESKLPTEFVDFVNTLKSS